MGRYHFVGEAVGLAVGEPVGETVGLPVPVGDGLFVLSLPQPVVPALKPMTRARVSSEPINFFTSNHPFETLKVRTGRKTMIH